MSRMLRLLTAGVVCSVAACGSGDGVKIVLFQASPDAIEAGQSAQLLYAVDPPDAKVVIAGVGDMTGRPQATVAPLSTTSYVLTATSGGTTASETVTVTVKPLVRRVVLTIPADANAGYPVTVGVAIRNMADQPIADYTGTVTFTSSDTGAGAVVPAPITFTGKEGGVASTTATFVTLGTQTLAASDDGTPRAAGSATAAVHGLAYSAPTSGRVRLVANAAQSNGQVVQLDLVANERLELSTFFGGGPGSFAAGMNLPLDTTRVTGDTTLFVPGPALPAGPGTRAAAARIGDDHVLYTAVSRKRVAGTIFVQSTEVQAGQVFYSVRLKLLPGATRGPVFDGAQPSPLYRASVRDQWGDDFVTQSDIGVGRLEVR